MAKKRKKLTTAFENIDPDVPTEVELRLEAELRSAYEADILTEGGGGLKNLVAMDVETLTLIDRGCDRVQRNRIGREGDLEKFLEQLTKEQLLEIVKEALEKDKELEESVKKRFGSVLFKRSCGKEKVLVSHERSEANVEKRHLDKCQDQLLVLSRRDGRLVDNMEKRHLDEIRDSLQVSSRRERDSPVLENVGKRHLDEAQDQMWRSSRRDKCVVENVEKRHLDDAQDQLRVSSWRDKRAVENVEKRHLDKAQDQLWVSSGRDNKFEFAQRERRKGNREEMAIPGVGAFDTTSTVYLRSYGDEEQLHCSSSSWSNDYKKSYMSSGYWHGHLWLGGSTYDPPISGARTFNPEFGQISDSLISGQGTADYWLNSLPGGTFAAPMNQPGSLYSHNASFVNMHNGYWPQNSQFRQPHSLYVDNRNHRRSTPR